MRVIPHIGNFHFADFMNDSTVVTVIEYRWKTEYGIKHTDKHLLAPHQVDQSLYVMEHRPGIVPAISFGKSISPFKGIKRRLERTVGILSTHQFRFRIKQVAIVLTSFFINVQFLGRTSQFLAHTIDTPVIISIFQRTCSTLIDLYIVWYVTHFIIIFISTTSGSGNSRMYTVGTFQ